MSQIVVISKRRAERVTFGIIKNTRIASVLGNIEILQFGKYLVLEQRGLGNPYR